MPTASELMGRRGPVTDKDFNRDYTRVFEVIFADNEIPIGAVACIATGVALFSPHPEDSQALCINFRPEAKDEDRYWLVTLDYSTRIEVSREGQPQSQQPPLERKGKIRLSGRKYQEAMTHDKERVLIANAANDPLEHSEERVRLCIQIQRNMPFNTSFGSTVFNPLSIEQYMGAINSAPFLGFGVREVLCDDLSADMDYQQGQPFWDVNALFVINRFKNIPGKGNTGGWLTRKLNAGYRKLVVTAGVGAWLPILENGQRPARPVLLDTTGNPLPPGTPAVPAVPNWLTFFTKEEADFNQIGLLN